MHERFFAVEEYKPKRCLERVFIFVWVQLSLFNVFRAYIEERVEGLCVLVSGEGKGEKSKEGHTCHPM